MGKTDTIRQRRVDVWVPTLEAKDRWKDAATKQGMSLSKLIIQVMEETIHGEMAQSADIEALEERIADLEAELAQRDERIDELRTIKQRLEQDIESYRTQDILEPGGMKILDQRLIKLLADAQGKDGRRRIVTESEILKRLRIKPGSDDQQAVILQLEGLELHGVIQGRQTGWIWHD